MDGWMDGWREGGRERERLDTASRLYMAGAVYERGETGGKG